MMIYFLQDEGCLLECQGLKDGLCIFKVKKGLGSSSNGLPRIQKTTKSVRDPDIEDRTQK